MNIFGSFVTMFIRTTVRPVTLLLSRARTCTCHAMRYAYAICAMHAHAGVYAQRAVHVRTALARTRDRSIFSRQNLIRVHARYGIKTASDIHFGSDNYGDTNSSEGTPAHCAFHSTYIPQTAHLYFSPSRAADCASLLQPFQGPLTAHLYFSPSRAADCASLLQPFQGPLTAHLYSSPSRSAEGRRLLICTPASKVR